MKYDVAYYESYLMLALNPSVVTELFKIHYSIFVMPKIELTDIVPQLTLSLDI